MNINVVLARVKGLRFGQACIPQVGMDAVPEKRLQKCPLCRFLYRPSYKGKLQGHLMRKHGVKLKHLEDGEIIATNNRGRILDDYTLNEKFMMRCNTCKASVNSPFGVLLHEERCAVNKVGRVHCETCEKRFEKAFFHRHLAKCNPKNICCRLCTFKCNNIGRLSSHTIGKHNLIPKPVDETDFDQALHGTPYTLERAVVLDDISEVIDMTAQQNTGFSGISDPSIFENEDTKKNKDYQI